MKELATDRTRTAHIIAHSHWDREWYLPYEKHRLRLVRLFESLLELFARDPDYGSFHLDGQYIVLEDYLDMMPHRAEEVRRLIREGRLIVGPWYVLQDEFLISSEANARNLLFGMQLSEAAGGCARIGYFPDSFGNIGQAPQLIRQAGIDVAVYGRGVKPVGFGNAIGADAPHATKYSEMFWEAPDGSRVLGVLFANWYHNAMEMPTDPEEARTYWTRKLADAEAYAATPELLFMNGCDHQPPQRDLTRALAAARAAFPDVRFVQSSFPDYVAALRARLPDDLSVVRGELRSQWTDGWSTLVNTASARVYIKQANKTVQTLLEQIAEPLAVMALLAGVAPYPRHELAYAWKTLLRNHPHDSICGCSVDEVHREMMTRFDKARQVAEELAAQAADAVAGAVDTSAFAAFGDARPFVVFNTTGHPRGGVVTAEVELSRHDFRAGEAPHEAYARLKRAAEAASDELLPGGLAVVDADGRPVEALVRPHLAPAFGYELPDDRFRQPYWALKAEVRLHAPTLPAYGCAAFAVVRAAEARTGAGGAEAAAASDVPRAPLAPAEAIAPLEAAAPFAAPSPATAAAMPPAPRVSSGMPALAIAPPSAPMPIMSDARTMDNGLLRVDIAADGSFSLLDRASGRRYVGLGVYEDGGDIGNEYMYKQPEGEAPLTTACLAADIVAVENSGLRAVCRITHRWELPAGAEPLLDEEIAAMVPFRQRRARRVAETRTVALQTELTLEKGARLLRIRSVIDNAVDDHRLRMLFPTGIATDTVHADSIYEIAARPIRPEPQWENPSNAQHMGGFVSMSGEGAGFTVATHGLHEYEALQDGSGTIAVTLLRGVRELGDWGVFPTLEAQCRGRRTAELAVLPHDGDVRSGAFAEAYRFSVPWTVRQTGVHGGRLPARHRFVEWEGERLAATALKASEQGGDVMLRLFNVSLAPTELSVRPGAAFGSVYKSSVVETKEGPPLKPDEHGICRLAVGPAEIVTLGLRRAGDADLR